MIDTTGIRSYPGEWYHQDGRVADIGIRESVTVILVSESATSTTDQELLTFESYDEARETLVNDEFKFRMF